MHPIWEWPDMEIMIHPWDEADFQVAASTAWNITYLTKKYGFWGCSSLSQNTIIVGHLLKKYPFCPTLIQLYLFLTSFNYGPLYKRSGSFPEVGFYQIVIPGICLPFCWLCWPKGSRLGSTMSTSLGEDTDSISYLILMLSSHNTLHYPQIDLSHADCALELPGP